MRFFNQLDNLVHPGADIAMDLPSMVEYKYHSDKKISHVVLGKGPPGGSWHRMDKNLRTLSLSAWMSLPNLNFNEWDIKDKTRQLVLNPLNTVIESMEDITESKTNLKNCDKSRLSNFKKLNENKNALINSNSLYCRKDDLKANDVPKQNNRSLKRLVSKEVETRAIVHRVAEYYESYVNLMDLKENFLNDTVVTCVLPFNKANVDYDENFKDARWIVSG